MNKLTVEYQSEKLWNELMRMFDNFSTVELQFIKSEIDVHEFIRDALNDSIENEE